MSKTMRQWPYRGILKSQNHRRDTLRTPDRRSNGNGKAVSPSSVPLVITRPDDHLLIEATVRLLAKHAAMQNFAASLEKRDQDTGPSELET